MTFLALNTYSVAIYVFQTTVQLRIFFSFPWHSANEIQPILSDQSNNTLSPMQFWLKINNQRKNN